jgi:hypothetical protein
MPANRATLKPASSTEPMASVRRRARQSVRAANAPITRPAGTNFVPSQGRAASRAKQAKASRLLGRASSLSAMSKAPARQAAAVSSGYTAVP